MSLSKRKARDATLAGANYGARYNLLRCIQRPFYAIAWRLEQACDRIEIAHELANWNRELASRR